VALARAAVATTGGVVTAPVVLAARETLAGRRKGLRAFIPFAGPAFIASVAYMDPGNFATNIQAGSRYGLDLLWVVVLANAVAMLFQGMSAKLGIVTGQNLAELCRDHFPAPVVRAMWIGSEIAAMATDLAELLGGAIALALLFHVPLLLGMLATALATYALLILDRRGFRPVEIAIATLVCVICACYLVELAVAPPAWAAVALHCVLPRLHDAQALTIAVGIVGATVMPHAIYLHSGLTQRRIVPLDDVERGRLVSLSNREVIVALGIAGLVNLAMVAMAASVFHPGHAEVAGIESAYRTLVPLLGGAAAGVFLLSLFASGLSSSAVGTMAGQVVMQGFVGFTIPVWVRRLVTIVPAFVVVAHGIDVTQALILSQVVLSLILPVPMIALLLLSSRSSVMGQWRTGRAKGAIAALACGLVLALNVLLLLQTAGFAIPFPG
jgi:manganese transport protein